MMNILFLGPYCPKNKINDILRVSRHFSFSANVLEQALIEGFDNYGNVMVVSSLKMVTRHLFVHGYTYKHNPTSAYKDVILSHINIPLFDRFFNGRRKYREVIKQGFVPDIIFIYSIRTDDICAARLLKKKFPKAVVVNMITDLAQYMRDNPSWLYRVCKKAESSLLDILRGKYVDAFVLLSPYMKDFLPIGNKPFIIIEGIYQPENIELIAEKKDKRRIILYSGNLDGRYGILDLVNAFRAIDDPTLRLWLCGNGNTVNTIKELSLSDSRIKYLGVLPRKDVLKLQMQATLLVNPRHSNEQYTRFSFPSKTMEYMASGTPTLMSPLESLPDDYKEHLFLFNDESVEGMSKKIQEVLEMQADKLMLFGGGARNFILTNKTSDKQCNRIIDFALNNISREL